MGSFAPKGHARVDPQRPAAFAICDRCGFMYNHRDLVWDTQYMGRFIKRTGFLVCESCNDRPNPTLRPIVLPPDPVPILNPRSEPMHCHVFKPLADNIQPPHRPNPMADTIDTMFPPLDMWHDVTADKGSVCDTRSYKDGWSVPRPPIPPVLPEPPVLPPDATTDNDQVTADTTSSTADQSPIFPPVGLPGNTADTMLVFADYTGKLTNVFPDYTIAADQSTPTADFMGATADSQTAEAFDPVPPIFPPEPIIGNTADTNQGRADNSLKLVNAFPDYLYAADQSTTTTDTATVRADNLK